MKNTALITLLLLVTSTSPCSTLMAEDAAAAPQPMDQNAFTGLVAALRADDFATRLQAAASLKDVDVNHLQQIAELPEGELNAEVAARLFAKLDARYMQDDENKSDAASELLERLAQSDRLLLADGAQRILNRRWQRRVELAAKLLEKMGAEFRAGSFTGQLGMRWGPAASRPNVQLFVGEEWTGGDEGIAVMERLKALADPGLRASGLVVWLLEGHPLNDDQRSRLRDLVGESRINERSRVALGILGEQAFAPGVLVRHVSGGSSAAASKLQIGDVLTAMLDEAPPADVEPADIEVKEPQKLKDFDHLVERLKVYRKGDKIWLIVERGRAVPMNNGFLLPQRFPRPEPTVKVIEVTLKGWSDLEASPN